MIPFACAVLFTSRADAQNLLTNGDFELSHRSTYMVYPGDAAITGWTVGGPNNVDLIQGAGGAWVAQSGSASIDLNGWGESSLYQWVNLVAGDTYALTFWVSGNPERRWYATPIVKSMSVSLGGTVLDGNVTFDTSTNTPTNMGWTQKSYQFTATSSGSQALRFTSGHGSPMGMALDNVWLQVYSGGTGGGGTSGGGGTGGGGAVPEPGPVASAIILGAGLAWGVWRGRMRERRAGA